MPMRITDEILQTQLAFEIGKACLIPENLPNLITSDSRSLHSGQWFWPIKGESFDGHQFIAEAMAKGASGFSYQSSQAALIPDDLKSMGIQVPDSLQALQQLSSLWRSLAKKTKVIGITGSSGKTTAKELLAHMLGSVAPSLSSSGSYNNEIGVPLTLCRLVDSHRFAVIEMGARHAGDIKFLCNIAQPNVALLLNVGIAHLGEFGDLATLRRTKLELFTSTPSSTIAVCPIWDDELVAVAKKHHSNIVTFGTRPEATVYLQAALNKEDGRQLIDITVGDQSFQAILPFYHESLAINVCAALACGLAIDAPLASMVASLSQFRGVHRRFEIHRNTELTIIDDSYNANPESMMAGLRSLHQGFSDYKKVLILGDMLELGGESAKAHQDVGQYCAELRPEFLVTVGEESKHIAAKAKACGLSPAKIRHYDNVDELRQNLDILSGLGNLLYAKASNGIKLYKVIDDLTCNLRT